MGRRNLPGGSDSVERCCREFGIARNRDSREIGFVRRGPAVGAGRVSARLQIAGLHARRTDPS